MLSGLRGMYLEHMWRVETCEMMYWNMEPLKEVEVSDDHEQVKQSGEIHGM